MGIKITSQQDGFTIIEISLFFAVSGLLLATMMAGIGIAVQQQRFTDSANGTQSMLQQQYNETQVTINSRQDDACLGEDADTGASGCLIVGKLIDLRHVINNEVHTKSYRVIVNQDVADNAQESENPPSDLDLFNGDIAPSLGNIETKAIKSSESTLDFIIPWGADLDIPRLDTGDGIGTDARYILILRSPINGSINTYYIAGADSLVDGASDTIDLRGRILSFASNQSIKSCIRSADLFRANALLKITPGATQDSITTQFDTQEKTDWCDA